MIRVIEWYLHWTSESGQWEHNLVCKTEDQEIVKFGYKRLLKSFDEQLVLTDLLGNSYQLTAEGFRQPPTGRGMSFELTVDWIRQYWTAGETHLFTYIGHDADVDGDCYAFYHVQLKRPMGDVSVGSKFDVAKLHVTSKGIWVKLMKYTEKDLHFLIEWEVVNIIPQNV